MPSRPAPPSHFAGFADREARFFAALAKNQRRDWFAAHRAEYEEGWLLPMRALLAEVRERLDAAFPQHPLGASRVFRIHRDVRFASDKSPYKTHIGGYVPIDTGDEQGASVPIPLYLHIGVEERFGAAGHYMMTPDQLRRYRAAVLDEERGGALGGILQQLVKRGFTIGSQGTLARAPRGIDPAHPRVDLLRRKGLVVSFPELPKTLLVSRQLVAWLVKHATQASPLVAWLASAGE